MITLPRSLLIVALVGLVLACLGAVWAGGAATRELAGEREAADALDELAFLAGLVDEHGQLMRPEPMAVEVIQDGGPLWAQAAVERAVEDNAAFAVGNSPHLLRVEVVEGGAGVALQLHLWRAGWDLRVPQPRRIWVAPWAAIIAGVLGAVAGLLGRRLSLGFAAAGVCAQLLLGLAPLPADVFPPQRLIEAWSEGPLLRRLLAFIDGMGAIHLAVAAAVVAACVVLVAFDHRRSREREDSLDLGSASLLALLGTCGALAWIEAASRGSLFVALHPRACWWAGGMAVLGILACWVPAGWVALEGWRARR
ncbi:hypothetical protein G6O69_30645 [Pseudenhygromyxa sp. WMMC2535]|uniref:hypothetical protein n=1 Tax=Pseudenhygromyxa sp. WMMC2535 TaxID=2712867 RepID=UPI001552DF41|nr:hypothetical protein [Pseudenhygromyxa sp. WMMC2535]NVB42222.1 hypothetical protein [Pseudenhygromyxa sp. WMMC2535]